MSRPFTVQFRFHEQPVTALVHFDPEGVDLTCRVRYINREVARLIPGQQLTMSLARGLADESLLGNADAAELVGCTSEAIALYLEET